MCTPHIYSIVCYHGNGSLVTELKDVVEVCEVLFGSHYPLLVPQLH